MKFVATALRCSLTGPASDHEPFELPTEPSKLDRAHPALALDQCPRGGEKILICPGLRERRLLSVATRIPRPNFSSGVFGRGLVAGRRMTSLPVVCAIPQH